MPLTTQVSQGKSSALCQYLGDIVTILANGQDLGIKVNGITSPKWFLTQVTFESECTICK